jgi:hypothetical protein
MEPRLAGYFPKKTLRRPEWLEAAGVAEICSASECISKGPGGWVKRWLHNDLWLYDTPADAWSVVPEQERAAYELFAYRYFPVEFVKGEARAFDIPPLEVEDLVPSFRSLGFDVVSRSMGTAFECSPLSCNRYAAREPANRFCLFDNLDRALAFAARCEASGAEPGPYYVVEVFRQEVAGSEPT